MIVDAAVLQQTFLYGGMNGGWKRKQEQEKAGAYRGKASLCRQ